MFRRQNAQINGIKSASLRQIIQVWMQIRLHLSQACRFSPHLVVFPALQGQHKIPAKKSQN